MATFVVRMTHPSDQCPTANSKVRERVMDMGTQIPQVAERTGVRIVAGPLVLGCEHEAVAVVEAAGADNVNDFLVETGMVQWNSVRVSYAQPLEEALGEMAKMPPALY